MFLFLKHLGLQVAKQLFYPEGPLKAFGTLIAAIYYLVKDLFQHTAPPVSKSNKLLHMLYNQWWATPTMMPKGIWQC